MPASSGYSLVNALNQLEGDSEQSNQLREFQKYSLSYFPTAVGIVSCLLIFCHALKLETDSSNT